MKSRTLSIVAAVACFMMPATSVFAQAADTVYQVPFEFHANGVDLKAGTYTVSYVNSDLVSLHGKQGGITLFRRPALAGNGTSPHLLFYKSGQNYVLGQVWPAAGAGCKVKFSKRDQEVLQAKDESTVLIAASH